MISKNDVYRAQSQWADAIVDIGSVYLDNGDYTQCAQNHIAALYAYELSEVLFKPTLASAQPFRHTSQEALSYFVGGIIEEDRGFAIRPWKEVRFGEQTILTHTHHALAMGHYYFTPLHCEHIQKVEFTFGYIMAEDKTLRINLQHSSLPYIPPKP